MKCYITKINKQIRCYLTPLEMFIVFVLILFITLTNLYGQSNAITNNDSIFLLTPEDKLNTTYTMTTFPHFLNLLNVSSTYPIEYMNCGIYGQQKNPQTNKTVIIFTKTICENLLIFQNNPSQSIFDTKLEKIVRLNDMVTSTYGVYDIIPFQYLLKNLGNVVDITNLSCGIITKPNVNWGTMQYLVCNKIIMMFEH